MEIENAGLKRHADKNLQFLRYCPFRLFCILVVVIPAKDGHNISDNHKQIARNISSINGSKADGITHFLPSGVVNSFQTVDASALCSFTNNANLSFQYDFWGKKTDYLLNNQ